MNSSSPSSSSSSSFSSVFPSTSSSDSSGFLSSSSSFPGHEDDPTANFFAAASAIQSAGGSSRRGAQSVQLPTTMATPWGEGRTREKEFLASLPVFDMFPLSNGDENHLYAVLFLVGVCGNVSVITLIRHLHANTSYDNTMIYVLFLCCVDLASVVPLPMAIMDQLLGFWMFGTALYRFLRVCHPHKKTTRRMVLVQLCLLTLLTFVLLSPLLVKSSSKELVLKEVLLENPYRLARVRIFKCMDHLEGTLLSVFISYMFIIGYCSSSVLSIPPIPLRFFLPVLLIAVFYALMMRRLFRRSRSFPSSSKLPVNRIAGYTIAISVFFVLCWSPYWGSMLYFNFMHWDSEDQERNEEIFNSDKFIYIMYGIHALPYVNSASNWLLYGAGKSDKSGLAMSVIGDGDDPILRLWVGGLLNSQLMRRAKYTGESTYYVGGVDNGFGLRLASTNHNGTPPQHSITFRAASSSTVPLKHSSLAVLGSGRCNSTLCTPRWGGKRRRSVSGQAVGKTNCGGSASPSMRSISTASAPPQATSAASSGTAEESADAVGECHRQKTATGESQQLLLPRSADSCAPLDILL
uniref:G_PROTEIN_RECEP_F1_2 domain-containing protein n=1 Tax=Globodera pallida TaxID=36090 RepID=A0A183BM50_GLOPA